MFRSICQSSVSKRIEGLHSDGVLYGAMTDSARSLTVREFLHCYHPDEIDKSRGVYSFVPRSPLLKVIYETPDSNRDWKSRYFFLEGDN